MKSEQRVQYQQQKEGYKWKDTPTTSIQCNIKVIDHSNTRNIKFKSKYNQ